MHEYEITYLADPQLDEAAKAKLDEAVDTAIASREGVITHASVPTAPGSRRRLHYPIGKKNVAWLRTLQVQLDPTHTAELRQEINRQEGVLRTYVLQTPQRQEVAATILEQPATQAKPGKEAEQKEKAAEKPKKEITAEEVEKGIERALEEEVK